MAIARGAGTEIIRCATFKELDSTGRSVIIGVQYHIYTVLSIVVYAAALNAAGNYFTVYLTGYDALAGTSGENMTMIQQDMQVAQTYVWNDKFSFNGVEPTDFTGAMDGVDDQDAIADQAQNTSQTLKMAGEHASDNFNVWITYIDQNNA